jgi:hypothetical protein
MDENAGTTTEAAEAPKPADKPATDTQSAPDEVTTLRSRNAGLDAKVTELTKASKAAEQKAADALAKLQAYEEGKVGSEEALRAQLQRVEAEAAQARREAKVARIEAKFPETFKVFGDAVAEMGEDKLAEAETRFKGVPAESDTPPKPLGNNPSRTQGAASDAQTGGEETLDQMRKRVFGMALPTR